MFSQESNLGDMPIRVLQPYITGHFEQKSRIGLRQLKDDIKKELVKPGINYDLTKDKIKVPKADLIEKTMEMQEMFLSFLWSIIYSIWVIYEEAIMRKMVEGRWEWKIICDTPLTINAERLFNYGVSLSNVGIVARYQVEKTGFDWNAVSGKLIENGWAEQINSTKVSLTVNLEEEIVRMSEIFGDDFLIILPILQQSRNYKWDYMLPNPEKPPTEEERVYVDRITDIFLNSIVYLLLHEYAHLILQHSDKNEADVRVEQEKEADQFAREAVIDISDAEDINFQKGLALVIAHVASLFVIKSVASLRTEGYPDLHERLRFTLDFLDLKEKRHRDYLWYLACISCHKFLEYHGISVDLPYSFDDVEGCLTGYLDNFDRIC